MRTLHFGLRVADLGTSLGFYKALGYQVIGNVPDTPLGHLTMLRLPGDDFVTIELVSDPAHSPPAGSGLSHFVIKVETMEATLAELAAHGIEVQGPMSPDNSEDFLTALTTDPDGNRIELVQWPAGHADGMTAADFTD